MASVSEHSARHRLRLELWSWAAWLTLAVISYPVVTMIWLAPRAGLLSGLAVGLLVAYTASAGYAGRGGFERWGWSVSASLGAGIAAAAVALLLDHAPQTTAALCGMILTGEGILVWHFLPWLARDADTPANVTGSYTGGVQPSRSHPFPRASLSLLLLVSLLALGLGAVWSRGEARVPNPTIWIALLAPLGLALMLVARLVSSERASREGNLLMAAGAYRTLIGSAFAIVAVMGLLSAVLPRHYSKAERETTRAGSAQTTASPAGAEATSAETEQVSPMRAAAAALARMPRGSFPLLLLLLLLFLLVILLWGFRRSRVARWVVAVCSALVRAARRGWHRLCALLARLVTRPQPAAVPSTAPPVDPLGDPFEETGALEAMSPREAVMCAYHLLLNFAEMLGHGRRPGQTPFEYAQLLQQAVPAVSQPVTALTWGYACVMYGGEQTYAPEPAQTRAAWQAARFALVGAMPPEELELRQRAYRATRRLEHR